MNLLQLVTMACASWYISYVITVQDGPYGVLLRVRNIKRLAGVTACIYCTMPYVAGAIYIAYMHGSELSVAVVQILAIVGAGLFLRSYSGAGVNGF